MAKNPGKKAINIVSKLGLGITIALMTVAVTTAAVIGAVSGIAISAVIASYFPHLLPVIAGGVIGLGISPLYWTILAGPFVLLLSPIQFGIGVGLTALGLTSPAAIGALSAGLTAAIPFLFMLAGIGIWSGMMSSFMDLDEDKSPSQPVGRLDGGISFSRPGNVFDERTDTIFNTEIDADQYSGFAGSPKNSVIGKSHTGRSSTFLSPDYDGEGKGGDDASAKDSGFVPSSARSSARSFLNNPNTTFDQPSVSPPDQCSAKKRASISKTSCCIS